MEWKLHYPYWRNRTSNGRTRGNFIRECDSCQKRSYEQYDIRALHFTIGKYNPMESVSVDLVGLFRKGPTGNCYVLVCIDSFTRYMW